MMTTVRIGAYSSDPPACDAFHAFDPESYVAISAINDSLVYIDAAGEIRPGLAIDWQRIDPVTMEFELRRGVQFHNGEPFDADSVIATLRAQRDPAHRSPTGQGVLSPIQDCVRVNSHRVRVTSAFPDGMALHRLHLFSAIYPRGVLAEHGPDYFLRHPIGTGAYAFAEWRRGEEIVLRRNPEHWANRTAADELRFPIIKQKDWIDALEKGQLDIVLNLTPHDAYRAQQVPGLIVERRAAAVSQWFLLRNQGPLADRRVRQAMNYAIHRPLLCQIADHGWAAPQAGVQTLGQVGYNAALAPYPYDPDLAGQLLRDAGVTLPLKLTGLVSDTSASVYQLVQEFLRRIGIQLDAQVVPRGEWMRRVVVERSFKGDFVFAMVDNPLLHGIFHHFIFLFSQGPFTQMSDPEYDRRFLDAATTIDPELLQSKLETLDAFVQQEAYLLTTIRQEAYYGARTGFGLPISRSGHFNYTNLWNIKGGRVQAPAQGTAPAEARPPRRDLDPEVARIVDATSYPGLLYLDSAKAFEQPEHEQLWRNLELNQVRWRIESGEMIRALVDQVAAQSKFQNICSSTKQIGILGVTRDGRVLFNNDGYPLVTGHRPERPLAELILGEDGESIWSGVMAEVDRAGVWSGVVQVAAATASRPEGEQTGSGTCSLPRRLFLTATPAVNEVKTVAGYVCTFSDYSLEEERLRMKAEAETAAVVQRALIARVEQKEFEIADFYKPASETGGDWYCVHNGSRYLILMIGDVTSHGVAPALVTASVAGAVKVIDLEAESPSKVMRELNKVVCATGSGEYLMSFYLIKIDKQTLSYQYCSAGHPSPIFVRDGLMNALQTHRVGGELLGYRREAQAWAIDDGVLEDNTLIFLYTDGISEGRDGAGQPYGFAGLRRFLRNVDHGQPCRWILERLIADANRHYASAPLADDITLLLARLKRNPVLR